MTGSRDISELLKNLKPRLLTDTFVFVSVEETSETEIPTPLFAFREDEGLTLVLRRDAADAAGLSYEGNWQCITLMVHSSLQAVGLLARITSVLAEAEIPCNVVSAFYHDHLFVPANRANEAVEILKGVGHESTTSKR